MQSASAQWGEHRTVDANNRFANVGASIVDVGPNEAGMPVGILAHCSVTLIHERVFLTAGQCVGPALDGAPGGSRVVAAEALPPFVRVYVTLSPNARDRSTWIPVATFAGHPSLLPCPNRSCDGWEAAPVQGLSDVGLLFVREPVRGIAPARLATVGVLTTPRAQQAPMTIVGYGLRDEDLPKEKREAAWDGLRLVRQKQLTQVIDDTWATWSLPSELCDGDSGAPILIGSADRPETLEVVATISYVGEKCRSASIHPRIDTASVQQWIRQTIQSQLR